MGIPGRALLAIPFVAGLLLALLAIGAPLIAAAAPDPGPPPVSGAANAPAGTFTPAPLDFGDVPVGTTVARELIFKNTGDATLNFNRSSGPNPDHGDWGGINATDTALCRGTNLPFGDQCAMRITFTALAPGLVARTLTLYDDFTTGTQFSVELRGTGVTNSPAPTLTVASAGGAYRGTADLTATLGGCAGSPADRAITFTLATPAGSRSIAATTDGGGRATIAAASLAVEVSGVAAPIPAGAYGPDDDLGVRASFAGDATCGAASGAAALVVAKATPVLTFDDPGGQTYGAGPIALAIGSDAAPDPGAPPIAVAYDTPAVCSGPAGLPAAATIVRAGSCTITATQPAAGNPNYEDAAPVSRTIAIARATPAITWAEPGAIVYGTALDGGQLRAVGAVPGTLTYDPPTGTVLGAGPRTLSVTLTPDDETNYAPAGATVALTVRPAPLTVTANPAERRYGAADPAFTARFDGFVPGESAAVLGGDLTFASAAAPGSPVGIYQITPGGLTATNYALTFVPGALTITAAPLAVRAQDAEREYGAADPSFAARFEGFVGQDGPGVLDGTLLCQPAAGASSPPGAYAITCGGLTATNYDLTFTPGTLTITAVAVALAVSDAAGTWGDPTIALVATLTAGIAVGDGTVEFTIRRGETVLGIVSGTPDGAGVARAAFSPGGLAAGTYTIAARYAGTTVFGAASGSGDLLLARAAQTISFAELPDRAYDSPAFDLAASASSGLAVTFSVPVGGPCALTGPTVTLVGIGTCTVTAAQAGDTNREPAPPIIRSFAITRALPTLTWATPAAIDYGTALTATQLNASADVPGSFAYDPPPGAVLGAGAGRTLTVTFTPDDGTTYGGATLSVALTVRAVPLIVTARPATTPYGAALPAFDVDYDGFVPGESPATLGGLLGYTTVATKGSPVGDYQVVPGGLTSANYALTFRAGVLTITPVPLTITAGDRTRPYGAANPTLTASYDGLVNDETPGVLDGALQCSTVAGQGSIPGRYPIACAGQTATNYDLTYRDGVLTVEAAPLTITADAQRRAYGAPNPALTATYDGFAPGEGPAALGGSLACATAAAASSPAGPYAITCSGHTSTNYAITYRAGTLTVTGATSATAPSDTAAIYGAAVIVVPVAVTSSGPVNEGLVSVQIRRGETVIVTGFSNTVVAGATSVTFPGGNLGAGVYTLAATYHGTDNIALSTGGATLTIEKAAQAITFDTLPDLRLGDAPFTLVARASSGLRVGFSAGSGAACAVEGTTVTLLADGTCAITASQPGDDNHHAAPPITRSFRVAADPVASPSPSASPVTSPSPSPTPLPTAAPSSEPSSEPSAQPSAQPSPPPTAQPSGSPVASPSPGAAPATLTLLVTGAGSVDPSLPGPTYPAGTRVILDAVPAAGHLFLGWTVDGQFAGWNPRLTVAMSANREVAAAFAPRPAFCDISPGMVGGEAIARLAALGIIRGYGDGCYGPDDPIVRAQMAGLIVRAMAWDGAPGGASTFADRQGVDDELWRAVGTLAARGVARGYEDGTYRPLDPVLHVQAVSFVTRAMVAAGYWQPQPDDPTLYPNVSADSGHREDLATFVHYAGPIPGTGTGAAWAAWDQPATRAWFAQLLWQALDRQFGAPRDR